MTEQHPITPPPELARTIWSELRNAQSEGIPCPKPWDRAIAKAYQAGADMELEARVNYVDNTISGDKARALRAIRRPKPLSLKEQALAMLDDTEVDAIHYDTICHALEALPND